MATPPSKSALEIAAGNVATQSALAAIAATAGGPLAALLPVLAGTLASGRQQVRVTAALEEFDQVLRQHASKLQCIEDSQYKLINEAVLAALHTTETEKLRFLRHVVENALCTDGIPAHEAVFLSRTVRDISVQEIKFLLAGFDYEFVELTQAVGEREEKVLQVARTSQDASVVSGLVSLGILVPAGNAFEDMGRMRFATITAKLLALLKSDA